MNLIQETHRKYWVEKVDKKKSLKDIFWQIRCQNEISKGSFKQISFTFIDTEDSLFLYVLPHSTHQFGLPRHWIHSCFPEVPHMSVKNMNTLHNQYQYEELIYPCVQSSENDLNKKIPRKSLKYVLSGILGWSGGGMRGNLACLCYIVNS